MSTPSQPQPSEFSKSRKEKYLKVIITSERFSFNKKLMICYTVFELIYIAASVVIFDLNRGSPTCGKSLELFSKLDLLMRISDLVLRWPLLLLSKTRYGVMVCYQILQIILISLLCMWALPVLFIASMSMENCVQDQGLTMYLLFTMLANSVFHVVYATVFGV